MSYRFENNDLLAIYEDELGRAIFFIVREIRPDLWEAEIYTRGGEGESKTYTADNKTDALCYSRRVFEFYEEATIKELHDGSARVSLHFGEMSGIRPGLAIEPEVGQGFHRAIVKVENWDG